MTHDSEPLIPLLAIVGPTAVGKTALAVELAERHGGEIVSADSRQVYRHMDIGTGKPTAEERARARHHLVDVVDPDQDYNVAFFLEAAGAAISDIHRRGLLPLLVGGTGHWVWGLLEGLRLPQVPPDPELRRELYAVSEEKGGPDWLWTQLRDVDPVAASRIDPRNVRRVIRAIEVTRATGVPFSQAGARRPPPYRARIVGLTTDRAELYRRIDRRVDGMFDQGWVEEVRRLAAMGYSLDLPALSSLGYREIGRHLRGEASLDEAVERARKETHRLARRQYSWFRPADSRITWLDITRDPMAETKRVLEGLAGRG